MTNVVSLAKVRGDRWLARRLELLVGDLDPAAMAVLETFDDADLEVFFRARKKMKEGIAEDLVPALMSSNDAVLARLLDKTS